MKKEYTEIENAIIDRNFSTANKLACALDSSDPNRWGILEKIASLRVIDCHYLDLNGIIHAGYCTFEEAKNIIESILGKLEKQVWDAQAYLNKL